MRYRRAFVPGGTYFFTVNLEDRRSDLLVRHIDALRGALRDVKARHPFDLLAMVVLPEHLHAIWRLPEGDVDFPLRWSLIKAGFSRDIAGSANAAARRRSRGERRIWQRRYWEHLIRDDGDLLRHVDYIHYNPVRHGWVRRAIDWPYSTLHRHVSRGLVSADWGCEAEGLEAGERR